jgi:hypothetical protein
MSRYNNYQNFDYSCPDCWRERSEYGGSIYHRCGLTVGEHKKIAKARKRADKQAHEVVVQSRMSEVYPKAIIKATYDEADRRVGG